MQAAQKDLRGSSRLTRVRVRENVIENSERTRTQKHEHESAGGDERNEAYEAFSIVSIAVDVHLHLIENLIFAPRILFASAGEVNQRDDFARQS